MKTLITLLADCTVIVGCAGALDRVALSSTLMPALDGEIPEVGNLEPMDLLAWEKQLDDIVQSNYCRHVLRRCW